MITRRRVLYGFGSLAGAGLAGCIGGFEVPGQGPSIPADTLFHFITTGQSLSTGTQGTPALTRTQPFHNVMFTYPGGPSFLNTPVNFNAVTNGYSGIAFTPLVNGPSVSGANGSVETIANGFADSLTAQFAAYRQLMSCSGVGGAVYTQLAGPTDAPPNGTAPFQEMMSQVRTGYALAQAAGLRYEVPAMLLVHGEFDGGNWYYAGNLATWQSDMQRGVQAITGSTGTIPIIAAQTQAQPSEFGGYNTIPFHPNAGPLGTLSAAIANPGLIYVACPEYMMAHHYYQDTQGNPDPLGQPIHMTADGYRHLGLMMAKAAAAICVNKTPWSPLVPLSTTLQGDKIIVDYSVPVEPIVIDTSYVSDPGNYGFNFTDNLFGNPYLKIAGVAVTGPAQITITLTGAPGGAYITYALVDPGPAGGAQYAQGFGPTAGQRGCVRDSDPAVSYYRNSVTGLPYPMQNYSVAWQSFAQQGQANPVPTSFTGLTV